MLNLPGGPFDVVYADPPWRYSFSRSKSRQIENQYPTMSLGDIKALPVKQVCAADCVLFLWATSPKLPEAMQVIEAWGFTYKTCMVWCKTQIGMGYWARQKHELLLIATRGKPKPPKPSKRPNSVIVAKRGRHSEKPFDFYGVIEEMTPGARRLELFCRCPVDGWEVWGNELGTKVGYDNLEVIPCG
jgi:N6-adenosine-specific RNA methylase IME4